MALQTEFLATLCFLSQSQAPEGTVVFEVQPDNDLICPLCFEILSEACSPTHCGHWFCKGCLEAHLQASRPRNAKCPKCNEK